MSAEGNKNSTRPSPTAKTLTERLLVYSSFRSEQAPAYVEAFKRMIGEFGADRVSKGLTAAIDKKPEFPPTPAEIRGLVPQENSPRPTCARCHDTEGWIYDGLDRGGNRAVRLCDHA
jgi:hypothetical protein